MPRKWVWRFGGPPGSQRAVSVGGFAIIAVGILCLCLSALVATTGSWWQGTLDAFGVGFVVGGVIDVLAISTLKRFISFKQERDRDITEQAERLLRRVRDMPEPTGDDLPQRRELAEQVAHFLRANTGAVETLLANELTIFVLEARGTRLVPMSATELKNFDQIRRLGPVPPSAFED